jgi:hypothetical protein
MGLAVSCGRRLDALVLELQHCGCGTAEEHRALLYCTHHAMREREGDCLLELFFRGAGWCHATRLFSFALCLPTVENE